MGGVNIPFWGETEEVLSVELVSSPVNAEPEQQPNAEVRRFVCQEALHERFYVIADAPLVY